MSHEQATREEQRAFERFTPSKQAFIMDHYRFGIIKDISLGGIAMYCVNDLRIEHCTTLDIFLSRSELSLSSEQYTYVAKRLTPGQAMSVNHIRFKHLSSSQRDALWLQIKKSCLQSETRNMTNTEYRSSVSFRRHDTSPEFMAIQA